MKYLILLIMKARSSHQRCSVRKMLLEISQNSQENNCARVSFLIKLCARVSFLIKLQAPPATLLKKRLWHRCFPVNFPKFLRTPFSQNTSGRLLLESFKLIDDDENGSEQDKKKRLRK